MCGININDYIYIIIIHVVYFEISYGDYEIHREFQGKLYIHKYISILNNNKKKKLVNILQSTFVWSLWPSVI